LFGYALAPPISGPLNAISMRSTLLESLWAWTSLPILAEVQKLVKKYEYLW
jgi:hypothetical protein